MRCFPPTQVHSQLKFCCHTQTYRIRKDPSVPSGFERLYSKEEVEQYLPKKLPQFPSLAEWSQVDTAGPGTREQSKAFPTINAAIPRANASLQPPRKQATNCDAIQDIKLPRKPAVFTIAPGSKATGLPRDDDEMHRAMGETDLRTKFKQSTAMAPTWQGRQEIDDDLEAFELRAARVRLAECRKRAVAAARGAAYFAGACADKAETVVQNAIRKQKHENAMFSVPQGRKVQVRRPDDEHEARLHRTREREARKLQKTKACEPSYPFSKLTGISLLPLPLGTSRSNVF